MTDDRRDVAFAIVAPATAGFAAAVVEVALQAAGIGTESPEGP